MIREWKVGGKQGEGIDSSGEILALTLNRMGYQVSTYRHFMSLIKGGHTNYKVRIGCEKIGYHGEKLDILLALDKESILYNIHEVRDGGIVIYDESIDIGEQDPRIKLCPMPLTKLGKEAGGPIMKNMIALGATIAAFALDIEIFRPILTDKFKGKGDQVIKQNMEALHTGYIFYQQAYGFEFPFEKPKEIQEQQWFITGNEALAFGALAGGCRFLAAYPITPATDIMYWLINNIKSVGGTVVQTEDEIAAVNMAIGANYTGARAMTSTSGPGFSLMMEAIGLAGISETPMVIVDVQRGGPSTGLPTKTEQSDLNAVLWGSHGEIPRIVLAPSSVDECFHFAAEAFNLAEEYQCPVLLVSDLYLGMNKQTIPAIKKETVQIRRGNMVSSVDLLKLEKGHFKRFEVTQSVISPRSIPSQKNGRFVAMGNEHDESGLEIEDTSMREKQMNKRMTKLANFTTQVETHEWIGSASTDTILVGWGSTKGVISEAVTELNLQGHHVSALIMKVLAPMDLTRITPAFDKAIEIIFVEQNHTGQLTEYMKQQLKIHDKVRKCLKSNGDPMVVSEIVSFVNQTKINNIEVKN
jgi:2-oxoglutarate ferredoxin oxidoreductase subunit alpha